MPNRKVHVRYGAVVGATYAGYRARDEALSHIIARAIGGGLGGVGGGRFADLAEPASWPQHRQVFHSVAGGAALTYGTRTPIDKWETHFHQRALELRTARLSEPQTPLEQFLLFIREMFYEVIAGIPSGAIVGHVSHLALDGTEGRIPLLGNPQKMLKTWEIHRRRQRS